MKHNKTITKPSLNGQLFTNSSKRSLESITLNKKHLLNNLQDDFSLVLSGGGALGIAHLNIIKTLQEEQLKPKEIIGTSMGAIMGACYALDYSASEIYQFIEKFSNIFKWGKLSFSQGSLLSTEKIAELFDVLYGEKSMAETHTSLKIVTTDFNSGHARLFDNNSPIKITEAVLASMAIPGIFPPVKIDQQFYVDGFIASNLPIEYSEYQSILACNVLGQNSFADFKEKDYHFFGHTKAVLEMVERSVRLSMYNNAQKSLQHLNGVVLIEPQVAKFKTYEFHKYKEILQQSLEF